ncbi:hypothetical protein MMC14_010629, partial [Varicellaria rhodocarpa]|nr:hypothetical protein [Varicellaria rhodocarpa]
SQIAGVTARAQVQPETSTQLYSESLVKSIETLRSEESRPIDGDATVENLDEETPLSLPDTDSEQKFYRSWGYLPPLDADATAEINAIMADFTIPEGPCNQRIGPEKETFLRGLKDRNVQFRESTGSDSYAHHIKNLIITESILETDKDRESHGQLWALDQAQCKGDSNEALFQRTLMMSLIACHCLTYARDKDHQRHLDFSVEEPWGCPPMPTRAYKDKKMFLTQPKPDLAVCFRRESIMSETNWDTIPEATMQLACYENTKIQIGMYKVFHFFTIEAKRGSKVADDDVGKRQSLNNASQALHNMFEFFRDAGPSHEEIFFKKVRFFSVVASSQGLTIRIHRAVRDLGNLSSVTCVTPEYPLRFYFEEYLSLPKNFKREDVLRTFGKILITYGEEELRPLLSATAEALYVKLCSDTSRVLLQDRNKTTFYRYVQNITQSRSKRPTPANSQRQSVTNESATMVQDETVTVIDRSQTPRPSPTHIKEQETYDNGVIE